jgi:2-C-methyl-D-erythritol 4-phosphate cytidylyltransferase / 2-C-methyl-D-erythritol 2,4-cyclodiphosphate synthase
MGLDTLSDPAYFSGTLSCGTAKAIVTMGSDAVTISPDPGFRSDESQTGSFACIVVAAGSGQRASGLEQGARPGGPAKQFRVIAGRTVLEWALLSLLSHPRIGPIVVVLPASGLPEGMVLPDQVLVTTGGATRTQSVKNGLAALPQNAASALPVLVHDAARPCVPSRVIDGLLNALQAADASAPSLPMADALKRTDAGFVSVSREGLARVQTPQAFRAGVLTKALAEISSDASYDDELEAARRIGAQIALVQGSPFLMKLTWPEDFDVMERLLSANRSVRTGQGFDVHGFAPGTHVTLCGIEIAHTARLHGHSDADVAWHALTDALLGAIGEGDIGDHFPPSDPQWRGAASRVFLVHAADRVRARGGRIENVDLTLICEAPRIGPHRTAMIAATAACLAIAPDRVSVKATTTEQLGFTGRREGIAAQALATISLPDVNALEGITHV